MFEFIEKYWYMLSLYSPLGAIGLWRWSVWAIRKTFAKKYRPIVNRGFSATFSVITPVYNENPETFKRALNSWKRNNPHEILAVIDYSDRACIKVFKKFSKNFPAGRLIITHKPGKRPALADGVRAAQGDIIALVDSDTVWANDLAQHVLAPFQDEDVGGVATRQEVLQAKTLAQKLFAIHLNNRYLDEILFLGAVGDALTCISGRTAVYRRTAVLPLLNHLENEHFLGKKCISGDDKCLTHLVQKEGWKVAYQKTARVWTPGSPSFPPFFKQQLRWRRNSWRADIKAIFSRWLWKNKPLALHTVDRFFQPFTLMMGPIFLIYAIAAHHWIVVSVLVVWWHVSRAIKIFPHLKQHPNDILILPAYVVTTYVLSLMRIYALFTMNRQGWATRWDRSRLTPVHVLRKVPAYVGTMSVVGVLVLGVGMYEERIFVRGVFTSNEVITLANTQNVADGQRTRFMLDAHKRELQSALEQNAHPVYTVQKGDTAFGIARRYRIPFENLLKANSLIAQNPNYIRTGSSLVIPFESLHSLPRKTDLVSWEPAQVKQTEKGIEISGEGAVVRIQDIAQATGPDVLYEVVKGVYELRAPIHIGKDVTFLIDGKDVSWLRLKSDHDGFVYLFAQEGSLVIQNTKITSWDAEAGEPDTNRSDGRSFLLVRFSGRMDIINSELSYLGFDGTTKIEKALGGTYGVSWRVPKSSIGKSVVSGVVRNSQFHHNMYGLYLYGTTGMIIEHTAVYDNEEYGVVTHGHTSELLVDNARIYKNGTHGIIFSGSSFNNIIANTLVYGNGTHGIVFTNNADTNALIRTEVSDNVDGMVIDRAYNTLIVSAVASQNKKSGVRLRSAYGTIVENSTFKKNDRGIFVYDQSHDNIIINNAFLHNKKSVYIKDAKDNVVYDQKK